MAKIPQDVPEWKYRRQFDYGDGINSTAHRTPPASALPAQLLSDEDLRFFLANGYLQFRPASLDEAFHARMFERFVELVGDDNERNPGNNLLPLVPDLNRVFEDPVVRGALQSVLGEDYLMHPHRVLHDNPPGSEEQVWHHDSYWGYKRKVHDHRPWWVMIMYYPQDLFPEIGPTGVIPGSYCIAQRLEDIDQIGLPASGEAGTCMMIHYDIWHRKMKNNTALKRFMIKFEFTRMSRPRAPTWRVDSPQWRTPERKPSYDLEPLWRTQYDFLAGGDGMAALPAEAVEVSRLRAELGASDKRMRQQAANALARAGASGAEAIVDLRDRLDDPSEPVGIASAYALAAIGEAGMDALASAMLENDGENVDDPRVFIDEGQHSEVEMIARNAAHALAACGTRANTRLLDCFRRGRARVRKYAVYALGQNGGDAHVEAALAAGSRDEDPCVRINAVEALGLMSDSQVVSDALVAALRDQDDEVRFNAALSLTRIKPARAEVVEALAAALYDGNRYVAGYACEALQRIGTQRALQVLLPYLQAARWCPITTEGNLF